MTPERSPPAGHGPDPDLRRAGVRHGCAGPGRAGGEGSRRAGSFQRKYLVVVTTTGGACRPGAGRLFEYLTGGDCATVAIQYSYLPSWISYLVDQAKALAAGRALFDAVYGAW